MTKIPILCLLASAAFGGTLKVCTTGAMHDGTACGYSNLQAAVDAAAPGDTILLKAGQIFAPVFLGIGKHDLTIKSDLIDRYPRGYRITRNHPYLARVVTSDSSTAPIRIGEDFRHGTVTVGQSTVTIAAPNHNFVVGDLVTVMGTFFTPFYCLTEAMSPFGAAQCTANRVHKFALRGNAQLQNGAVLYVKGSNSPLPTGTMSGSPVALQLNTPYYVVNYEALGSTYGTNGAVDLFQISATPGGPPIDFNDIPFNSGLMFEYAPDPARNYGRLYVVSTTSNTIRLSQTPGGTPIVWNQTSLSYNGSVNARGFQILKVGAVRDITFDGIEVTSSSSAAEPFILILIRYWRDFSGEHSGIRIRRCWLHGQDDQESLPHQGIILAAKDSEVTDSIIENMYSTGADTQGVAISGSTGNILVENNFISVTGEGIMAGGTFPTVFGLQTKGIVVRRNHLWKPLEWWNGISADRINATTVKLRSRQESGQTCPSQAASNVFANRCFWYEGTTRYELALDTDITITGSSSNGWLWIYGLGGQVKVRHNLTTGTVTCPAHIDCAYAAAPTFPAGSNRLSKYKITAGSPDASAGFIENRAPWVKNQIESKHGDNWHIEGNLLERAYFHNAVGQDMLMNITLAGNQSGDLDPMNYAASSSEWIVRNNIFRHGGKAIIAVGRSITPTQAILRYETSALGSGHRSRIENNLIYDIGSSFWTDTNVGSAFMNQYNKAFTWQHNTAVDIKTSVNATGQSIGIDFSANIFIPYMGTDWTINTNFPQVSGAGFVDWIQALGPGFLAFDAATSRFGRNILMNRNGSTSHTTRGVDYPGSPDTTYLVQANDPDRNPATLFETYVERNWTASNYRVKASEVSKYPTYTGRVIGADIDEIEALTGVHGADVIAGIPAFYQRSARRIDIGSTTAVLSYAPLSSAPCTIKIWNNNAYSGTPVVNTTDSGADVLGGRRNFRATGLSAGTAYYGKRWCNADVDVFSFTTLSSAPGALTITMNGAAVSAATALVEYGTSFALGSTTSPVSCTTTCTVTVPASATHYRWVFRNGAGSTLSQSDISTWAAE